MAPVVPASPVASVMSPGTYLSLRRKAAGLALEDVAARIFTDPRLSQRDRADWLSRIERDVAKPGVDVMAALGQLFSFDPYVLGYLVDLHGDMNFALEAPQICRRCGCTEADACVQAFGEGCSWVERDLCSACLVDAAGAA